ncbi:MAG: double zinc ribbon domain-containing protein [Negativicutes bacterium]|jgi:RNA polymerase subunit RPABC4/transcription elongation factor Spt4
MVSIGFIVAFLAAFWVYNDAKQRGHDIGTAILWSLGTLAMLVVFLPLYLLFGRKPQLKKNRQDSDIIDVEATVTTDSYLTCTMCGKNVKDEFNVCPYCGFTLKPECKNCGQHLSRDNKYCPTCQTPTDLK